MKLIVKKAQKEDAQGIVNVLNPIIADGRFTILPFLLKRKCSLFKAFLKKVCLMLR